MARPPLLHGLSECSWLAVITEIPGDAISVFPVPRCAGKSLRLPTGRQKARPGPPRAGRGLLMLLRSSSLACGDATRSYLFLSLSTRPGVQARHPPGTVL